MTQTDILTARQREALALVGEGLSTREIAARLGVTPRAGKAHVDTLRRKFGVFHKRELIRIALMDEDQQNAILYQIAEAQREAKRQRDLEAARIEREAAV